jgi:glycerophosphoryl diester phosphodiesterase
MKARALLFGWLGLVACGASPTVVTDAEGSSSGETELGETETDETTAGESETTAGESETGETGDEEPPGNLFLSDGILNIAHRGGGRLRPEATLPAFENALAVGADVLEFDLHATADGVIVVIHDDTVDRTTDGTGKVSEMTFTELRMLDAGYKFTTDGGQTFPYRGMGIQIPTVEEVLEAFPDEYYLMEIKQAEPSLVPDLLAILAAHEVGDRVVLASFQQLTIDEVRAADPSVFTAMTAAEMIDFYAAASEPGYVAPTLFVQAPWDLINPELMTAAASLELKVHPWTVNDAPIMHDLIGLGVDGIMTDDPALLDSVINH